MMFRGVHKYNIDKWVQKILYLKRGNKLQITPFYLKIRELRGLTYADNVENLASNCTVLYGKCEKNEESVRIFT